MTCRSVAVLCLMSIVPGWAVPCGASPEAGAGPVRVEADLPVETGVGAGLAAVEPHLAADPRDANHLVAGVTLVANLGDPRQPESPPDEKLICAALASFDGGRTWTRHDFPLKDCLDSWVVILPDGSTVFSTAASGRLAVFRSPDGGRTWNDRPLELGSGFDHPTMTVDRTAGPRAGNLYIAAHQGQPVKPRRDAIFVARSTDGGATFGEPSKIVSTNLSAYSMNPVVLPDGLLVVPFTNFARTKAGGERDLLDRPPSWTLTSADGGKTFSVPLYITNVCAGDWPELAADLSGGPFGGRLYWVCHDKLNEHIYLNFSTDRGETWSEPIVVNAGTGRIPHVDDAVIAVNRDGVVGVTWYDARHDPRTYRSDFRCQDLYFAASLDGGRTFLPEVKVSSAENCPDTPANGETGRRWSAGGDYHGLAAAADGSFHVLWTDSRDGIYKPRTATIHVDGKGVESKPAG